MSTKQDINSSNLNAITISLASPDDILTWSEGEVKKPETINYRTLKPEPTGLFCEQIFGPTKDFECSCGKYKRIRYKGIVCDRCGVEVTEKKVRRERMGHVKLVVPIVHIWYFRTLPNKIGYLLGYNTKKLDSIIYYEKYVVVQPGALTAEGVEQGDLITEDEYFDYMAQLPVENQKLDAEHPDKFIAKQGAEAIQDLLSRIDLNELSAFLRDKAKNETSQQRKAEALRRLNVVESFREANGLDGINQNTVENKPEWMVIQHLPVIPPELRPLVPLDGGRFASSDLNDLYRRVIIRNNRLKRLLEIKAPEVILRNEKRMLQEAVDSLFDNSRKSNAVKADNNRSLKSLSDVLKGKNGRFRQNLLGKRVDYSGRSVIVVGPFLKLHECGIPKDMAAELFKPFVIRKLIERGIVRTVKSAKRLVEKKEPVIWEILENILKGHPVMLNRAPTLHRLSIQAFQPRLIEGKAIRLHPLVCTAFNADFDGDQMAVHVPLSNAAILEAQLLMLSSHNILNPQNGTPVALPSQDMVLGLYYLTKLKKTTEEELVRGEGKLFYGLEDVQIAINEGVLDIHAEIKVRIPIYEGEEIVRHEIIDTTAGRAYFNLFVPKEAGFINELLTKKSLRKVISHIISVTNIPRTADFLDSIKDLGFQMSYEGGLSFGLPDLVVPVEKDDILSQAQTDVDAVWDDYNMGLITNNERYNQVIDIWTRANNKLTNTLLDQLTNDRQGFNPVFMMLDSGARGSKEQIRQLGGIRGLMAKPRKSGSTGGEIIENPILANLKEGLSVLEYFISTHGARKGLADTALKTADAGYLTRRLVDVSQDVVISEQDCGTLRGIETAAIKDNEDVIESLMDRIVGRISLHNVYHPDTEEVLVEAGHEFTEETAQLVEESGVETVDIRSVLTCESRLGVCVSCYGRNLAYNKTAQKGDAVGIMAAQSIGEPGTQLTLRTFHVGGTASHSAAENSLLARFNGKLQFDSIKTVRTEDLSGEEVDMVIGRMGEIRTIDSKTGKVLNTNHVPYGSSIVAKDGQEVKKGDTICSWDPYNAVILSEVKGKIQFENIIEGVTYRNESDEQTGHKEKVITESRDKTKIPSISIVSKEGEVIKSYNIPVGAHLIIDDNESVHTGQVIVKIPRVLGKIRDITGGLPRVVELFESRSTSNPAAVTEIDGLVEYGGIKRGNREIKVISKNGLTKKYMVPLTKHILVQEGDYVKAGEQLSDGNITTGDILNIKGTTAVQMYIVNEIQEVYRLQGVKINDKHIEVIVRQMMRKVRIIDPGDTRFLENSNVDKFEFLDENDRIYDKLYVNDPGESITIKKGDLITERQHREEVSLLKREDKQTMDVEPAKPATAEPILQGITKAALRTQSWISAASFQETQKILSEASITAKRDELIGLKENVIIGGLIPAGTGDRAYRKLAVRSNDEQQQIENRMVETQKELSE